MNPIDLLRKIPARARFWMLAAYTVALIIAGGIAPIWIEVDPRIMETLKYVGMYLGVQSAANVTVIDPDAEG